MLKLDEILYVAKNKYIIYSTFDIIINIYKMKGEEKLQALRKEMQARKYDAYIIPHGDQHDVI